MTSYREIRTAADADAIRPTVELVYEGWFADTPRIDWEAFVDAVETRGENLDLGEEMNSPAIRRIKAIVKEMREASA